MTQDEIISELRAELAAKMAELQELKQWVHDRRLDHLSEAELKAKTPAELLELHADRHRYD